MVTIELLFALKGGHFRAFYRWSVGMRLCWVLNTFGLVIGWWYDTMNRPDNTFLDPVSLFETEGIVLADLGFRAKQGTPHNLKLCPKGAWNEHMAVETTFSLLTVVCHAKKVFHRRIPQLEACFAYTAAMFNLLVRWSRLLTLLLDPFKVSNAQFSL